MKVVSPICLECDGIKFEFDDCGPACVQCGWRLEPEGYLYVIRSTSVPEPYNKWGDVMYKIGYSKDPEKRLKQHKTNTWREDLELISTTATNNMKSGEQEWKQRLEKWEGVTHVRGEWYILSESALRGLGMGKKNWLLIEQWGL